MLKKLFWVVLFAISVFAEPTLINLEVSDKRTIGRSKGLLSDRDILRKEAISAAKGEADILVETDFFYEEDGDSLNVTVTGFPARYTDAAVSVRQISPQVRKDTVSSLIPVPSPQKEMPNPVSEDKERLIYKSGLYVSVRTQTSVPWSSIGGNFQAGYFADRTFVGVDFGAGKGDYDEFDYYNILNEKDSIFYCGSLSFGGRIKPNDNFQVVLGATIGLYTKFEVESDYNYDDDYYYEYHHSYDGYISKTGKVVAQGPFVKFLFRPYKTVGKQKRAGNVWFELSNKFVFGYPYAAYNIEVGITYAP